jgi:ATP-dependent DNA helicase RecG
MRHAKNFSDEIPASFAQAFSLADLHTALQFLHQPPRETNLSELTEYKTVAHKRLIFEELLAHRLSLLQLKKHFQQQKAPALSLSEEKIKLFLGNLSFQLTAAQRRVLSEIQNDLTQSSPMLRLVQGDVGSGKTIIAALAMLQAVTNGYQAVMMAPTELLAEQHYHVMQHWFAPLSVEVVFLSSQVKGRAREKVFHQIKNKTAHIVVGTHALYQEDVEFADLALIVIDEQHRFGVEQRVSLREKGRKLFYPHQLMLTATPIPRTLAMRFYADLDCSIIDELPPGRTPIFTSVMPSHKRDDIILRIREACQQGRQVYWVCPLIEESEVLSCQSAITTSKILQQQLSEIKIGLVHGRMRAQEKENIMRAFKKNELHLLVATTVIEVGVDVPNASVMIIENAERLGLSQLHQLRGRVGRGTAVSHCILLYQHLSDIAKQRLSVMRETTDGFKIAECDLSLRGPGEVLGLRQTGDLSFRVADLLRDQALLTDVQHAADIILRDHPECIPTLIARWVGNEMNYG